MNPTIYIESLLTDEHKDRINNYISKYTKKNDGFKIEVSPVKDKRSIEQNKYYWGVLVKALMIINAETGRASCGKRACDYEFKKVYQCAYRLDDLPEHKDFDVGQMINYLEFCMQYLTDPEYEVNATIAIDDFNKLEDIKRL